MKKPKVFPRPPFQWPNEDVPAILDFDPPEYDLLIVRFGPGRPGCHTPLNEDIWPRYDRVTGEILGMNIFDFELALLPNHPELLDDWLALRERAVANCCDGPEATAYAHRLLALTRRLTEEHLRATAASPA